MSLETLVDRSSTNSLRGWRGWYLGSMIATFGVSVTGVAVALLQLAGHPVLVNVTWLLPFGGLHLYVDTVSAYFDLLTGFVGVLSAIYAYPYFCHERVPRFSAVILPFFVAMLLLVPLAATYYDLWIFWEGMALTSAALVLTHYRNRATLSAGILYIVITQIGFLLILGATAFLNVHSLSGQLMGPHFLRPQLVPQVADVIFIASFFGFASKCGQLPFHSWLPRAHPEAPTPISALMSAAMVNLGVYGIIRIDLMVLGPGERWWGIVLIATGATTALYGALHSLVSVDLKGLLAWSTSENMGIVVVALGAFFLFRADHDQVIASIALAAAIVHLAGHTIFKSLGFLSAGSVIAAAGARDLDQLGGMIHTAGIASVGFGVAALGATGLPLGAGFIGEWLLLQSLIHTPASASNAIRIIVPLAVGILALTIGLKVAAMTKAFGTAILSRPRSQGARESTHYSRLEAAVIVVATAFAITYAVVPSLIAPLLDLVMRGITKPPYQLSLPSIGINVSLHYLSGTVSPLTVFILVVGMVAMIAAITEITIRRRGRRLDANLWACGSGSPPTRMQYNAVSFAQPLEMIFSEAVAVREVIGTQHADEEGLIIKSLSYERSHSDVVEAALYPRVMRVLALATRLVQLGHRGTIRLYLLYGAIGLIVVLLVAR
ncbi:MAG: proton-conducting transporter transmembrane domain-containing protein [Ferrimicrobium sp.]